MIIKYGTVALLLQLIGGTDSNEFFPNSQGILTERRPGERGIFRAQESRPLADRRIGGRRLFRDREPRPQKPSYDDDLSRLLTEFGGVHVSRLLRGLSEMRNGNGANSLGLSLEELSSLAATFRSLGGSEVDFNDLSRLITEVERRGIPRGERDRDMREEMVEVVKMMTKGRMKGSMGNTQDFESRGLNEEEFNILLQLLTNRNAKEATTPTNRINKEEEIKEEKGGRGRNIDRAIEPVRPRDASSLQNERGGNPISSNPEQDTSASVAEIVQLLALLEGIEQLEGTSVNDERLLNEVQRLNRGRNIISEGVGALGYGLGTLFSLASLSTLTTAAVLAHAGIGTGIFSNNNFNVARAHGNLKDEVMSGIESRTTTNPNLMANDQFSRVVGPTISNTEFPDSNSRKEAMTPINIPKRNSNRRHETLEETNKFPLSDINIGMGTEYNRARENGDMVTLSSSISDAAGSQYSLDQLIEQPNPKGGTNETSAITQIVSGMLNEHERSSVFGIPVTKQNPGIIHADEGFQSKDDGMVFSHKETSESVDKIRHLNGPVIPKTERESMHTERYQNPLLTKTTTHSKRGENSHISLVPINRDRTALTSDITAKSSHKKHQLNNGQTLTMMPNEGMFNNGDLTNRGSDRGRSSGQSENSRYNDRGNFERSDTTRGYMNLFIVDGNRRSVNRLAAANIPAEILFRAAVMGESPSFVFGQAAVDSASVSSIQPGIVRHIGTYPFRRYNRRHLSQRPS